MIAHHVEYVSIDFDNQSLTERLLGQGFDPSKSTLFTLEGVSQYISKVALATTIRELSTLTDTKESVFCFSYVNEQLIQNPRACFGAGYPNAEKRAKTIMQLSAKFGEPWQSLYSPQEVETILRENGFNLQQDTMLAELNELYFEPVGRKILESEIMKLEHFVIAHSSPKVS